MTTALPNSPPGHRLLGHLPEFRRDPLSFMLRCTQEYGRIVPLRFGPARTLGILLHDPALIEKVLVTDHSLFHKGRALQRSTSVFGNGLLTSEDAFWRRQRKLIQPAFHRERIPAYGQIAVDCAQQRLASWQAGQTFDLAAEMSYITLQIAVKTLFGTEIREAELVAEALDVMQQTFARWMHYVTMLPDWIPTPTTPRLTRAIRRMDAVIYDLIRQRRASGEERDDLLSMLLRAQDEGTSMTDKQLRDEMMTLFLAGHETTALMLTWTWVLLARNPDAEARLMVELEAVLGGRAPTVADRPQLKVTEQTLLESMRLYPPAWAIGRMAQTDYQLDCYRIPAGTPLIMSQYVMHRDPQTFPEPERFRPERWTEDFTRSLSRGAYFPFGAGPRVCIGNTFAMMEGVLLLAAIAQQWRICIDPTQNIELLPAVTLRPRHGIQADAQRRRR